MDTTSVSQVTHAPSAHRPEKYRTAGPVRRHEIQGETVDAHRRHVAEFVQTTIQQRHWTEARQLAVLGLLVAFERYESARDGAFWPFAFPYVCDEIRAWMVSTLKVAS